MLKVFPWFIVSILIALCVISAYDNIDWFRNSLELAVWNLWIQFIFALSLQFTSENWKYIKSAMVGGFICSSIGISILLFNTTYWVVSSGPLNESAIVFIVAPYYSGIGALTGVTLGLLVNLIYTKYKNA